MWSEAVIEHVEHGRLRDGGLGAGLLSMAVEKSSSMLPQDLLVVWLL